MRLGLASTRKNSGSIHEATRRGFSSSPHFRRLVFRCKSAAIPESGQMNRAFSSLIQMNTSTQQAQSSENGSNHTNSTGNINARKQSPSIFCRFLNRLSFSRRSREQRREKKRQQHQSGFRSQSASKTFSSVASTQTGSDSDVSYSPQTSATEPSDHHVGSLDDSLDCFRCSSAQQGDDISLSSNYTKPSVFSIPEIVLRGADNQIHRHEFAGRQPSEPTHFSAGSEVIGDSDPNLTCRYLSNYESKECDQPFSLPSSPMGSWHRVDQEPSCSSVIGYSSSPRLSHSPVPFKSPPSPSSRIEDGLEVTSIENFEKHIDYVKQNQVEAQKKLFSAWINHFCPNLIRRDLCDELRDGLKLIGLLATLTSDRELQTAFERLKRDRDSYIYRISVTPSSKLKQLSNVSTAVNYMRERLGMKLVNLHSMDIVNGNTTVILGLCWSIILHFQLDKDCRLLSGQADRASGRSANSSTLGLSSCQPEIDPMNRIVDRRDSTRKRSRSSRKRKDTPVSHVVLDEYTNQDLTEARKRLVAYINKRFNLRLTNLTSNLFDGDVLMIILKQIIEESTDDIEDFKDERWRNLSQGQKLDRCFKIANRYLKVPVLFSSADLQQNFINQGNYKPLLVYLSMLLNSSPKHVTSPERKTELNQANLDLSVSDNRSSQHDLVTSTETIESARSIIDELEMSPSFELQNLKETLSKLRLAERLIKSSGTRDSPVSIQQLDPEARNLYDRFLRIEMHAKQIDDLIDWINKADRLFEIQHNSKSELADTIRRYRRFFSPKSMPQVQVGICPTLERQYHECITVANERISLMEQTMKNWIEYDEAKKDLEKWLLEAELILGQSFKSLQADYMKPKELLDSKRVIVNLEDEKLRQIDRLVTYFELEENDHETQAGPFTNLWPVTQEYSLSTSSLSLSSISSQISTFTASDKAKYHRLFEDFELKCRVHAAMLEYDQKEALLSSVKDFKTKLNQIIKFKVPQMINELSLKINQDESSTDGPKGDRSFMSYDHNSTSEALDDVRMLEGNDNFAKSVQDSSSNENTAQRLRGNKGKETKVKKGKSNKLRNISKLHDPGLDPDDQSDNNSSMKAFWDKLVRASKLGLPINIVLIICLAGICAVPLMGRDACCELSQRMFTHHSFSLNRKPI